MNNVLEILKKHDKKSATIAPSDSNQLPAGSYVGLITKGEVFTPKGGDTDSVFVRFNVKVTEGELAGQSGMVSQNIIKGDGGLNDTGVSIVKGMFRQMFGAEKANALKVSEFVAMAPKAAGFGIKWRVTENGENTNQKVLAIIPKEEIGEPVESPAAKTTEVEADEPEGDEPEGDEPEAEAAPSIDEVKEHLTALDRTGLKSFIKENKLTFVVLKKHTDDDIRKGILAEVQE